MHIRLNFILFWLLCSVATETGAWQTDWPSVGNDRGYSRYSALEQINRSNVHQLRIAWRYSTGEGDKTCECTPVVVDGVMYISTNHLRVCALDAATGRELWSFDPFKSGRRNEWHPVASIVASRIGATVKTRESFMALPTVNCFRLMQSQASWIRTLVAPEQKI